VPDESFGDDVSMERGHDQRDVAVCTGVVVSKETYCEGYAEVVVEETYKESVCLVVAEGFLLGPVLVLLGKPEKVVVAWMYTSPEEMQKEWVARARMSMGLKNPD
jgi:hypothetical protein